MIKDHFWKIFAVVAVVMIGAAFAYSSYVGSVANEGVEFQDHVKGNPDADVVLVKYSDFQCPACAQFSVVIDEMLQEYGEHVRFEYRHFPLITIHPNAVPAARAAEAAGQQGQFFAMHDRLFAELNTWGQSTNPQTYFTRYAEEIGLDMDLFRQHVRSSAIRDHVMGQYNEARDMNFTGTPTFMLNGERMQFTTFQDFFDQIAAAVGELPETEDTVDVEEAVESVDSQTEPDVEEGQQQ